MNFQILFTLILLAVAVVLVIKMWGWLFKKEEEAPAFDTSDMDLDLAGRVLKKHDELKKLKAKQAQLDKEVATTEELVNVSKAVEQAEAELNKLESQLYEEEK